MGPGRGRASTGPRHGSLVQKGDYRGSGEQLEVIDPDGREPGALRAALQELFTRRPADHPGQNRRIGYQAPIQEAVTIGRLQILLIKGIP